MKYPIYLLFFCFAMSCTSTIKDDQAMSYKFLVGTYTDNQKQGIDLLEFNPSKGTLELTTLASGISNPSFVIANKNEDLVFAVEETSSEKGGKVLVFERNKEKEKLNLIDSEFTQGDHPCHLSLSPNEDFLVVSNYSGGNLAVFKIENSGQLKISQVIQHEGSSINPDRQEGPHVHSATFDPSGKYLLVADLGKDAVMSYKFDPKAEQPFQLLVENSMQGGDGPRHLAFSASGEQVYVVQEMTALLEIFNFNEGNLSSFQRLPLTPSNFSGEVGAAEIRVSADDAHIYVSNRGEANTLSIFEKKENGEFQLVKHNPSGGLMPRNFVLSSDEKYVISAHQESHDFVVFKRDTESGELSPTNWRIKGHRPVYLYPLNNH
ncbi:lactonase family protein [Algoriphagus faecimaris]|nr:lactonase family protein [Algoriphagus faecimaris]